MKTVKKFGLRLNWQVLLEKMLVHLLSKIVFVSKLSNANRHTYVTSFPSGITVKKFKYEIKKVINGEF